MDFTDADRAFLKMAIDEAELDPRLFQVGAVIVKGGKAIAKAHGGEDTIKKMHAEFAAIKKCPNSSGNLLGATLYTTLEPCVPEARHPGRDPCATLIINVGITRVVIGVLDPNPAVCHKGYNSLSDRGIKVTVCSDSHLRERIRSLNKKFFEQEWPRYADYPGFAIDRYFGGRLDERIMLTDWVSRRGIFGGIHVMVLHGIPGIGKSSLTWFWCKRDVARQDIPGLPNDPKEVKESCQVSEGWLPSRVMWFSFYKQEGGGDFFKFLERAIEHFSAGLKTVDDYNANNIVDYRRMSDDLLDLLRTQRFLIVWDGAERLLFEYSNRMLDQAGLNSSHDIKADEKTALRCVNIEVSRFLWVFTSQSISKLLITSRVPFADLANSAGASHVELLGLDPPSSVKFLKARGIKGPDVLLEERAKFYEFHPLSLSNLAASLLDDFESEADITGSGPDDPGMPLDHRRNHVLKLAFERRASQMQQLLTRLAAIRGPITKDLVKLLTKDCYSSHDDLGRHLHELARHGLLRFIPETSQYDMHPVVREYAYLRLDDRLGIHRLLVQYYEAKAGSPPSEADVSDDLLAWAVEAIYHLIGSGAPEEAMQRLTNAGWGGAYRSIFTLLSSHGKYLSMLELYSALFPDKQAIHPTIGKQWEAHVYSSMALAYKHLGQLRRAAEFCRRSTESFESIVQRLNPKNPTERPDWLAAKIELAQSLLNRSLVELQLGQLKLAYQLIYLGRKHLSAVEGEELRSGKGLCVRLPSGEVFITDNTSWEFDRAEASFYSLIGQSKRAEKLSKHGTPKEWQEIDKANVRLSLYLKARLAIERSDIDSAAMLAEELSRIVEEAPEIGLMVKCKANHLLGMIKLRLGELDLADKHLTTALGQSRSTRAVIEEAPILLELGKLALVRGTSGVSVEQADKHLQLAKTFAEDALRLANWCGSVLEEAEIHILLSAIALSRGNSEEARKYAKRAKELALCGGKRINGPYFFARVYAEADRLFKQ